MISKPCGLWGWNREAALTSEATGQGRVPELGGRGCQKAMGSGLV